MQPFPHLTNRVAGAAGGFQGGWIDWDTPVRLKPCDLNQWRLWAAGYVIAGGMSDDSFHYFRSWFLGRGREAFEVAMKDPNELGPFVDNNEVDNELLEYVAVNVLEERGVEEDPRDRSKRRADDQPTGEPFEEDTVATAFPKLAALFGDLG